MSRLQWKQGRWNETGHVATLAADLFSISWSTQRADPKPWVLRCSLPGYISTRWQFTEKAAAKVHAERVLARFIAYLNDQPASPSGVEQEAG